MKMPFCSWAWALVLGGLVCLVAPVAARIVVPDRVDEDAVTVVLADGWEIANVYVEWSETDGALLVERTDGAIRLLAPEELAGVRDAWGRDVSSWYLPNWALARLGGEMRLPDDRPARRPIRPTPRPAPKPTPRPLPTPEPEPDHRWREIGGPTIKSPERDFISPRVILGFEMGYSAPHDDDFGHADGGLGVEATLRLQLSGPLYVSGGYVHQRLNATRYDYPVICPEDGIDCFPYHEYDEDDAIRGAWIGLSLVSETTTAHAARFYLDAGVGRFDYDVRNVWSWEDNYVGYRLGAGFMFPLGPHAAIDLGVRALNIRDVGYDWDDGDTLLGGRIGVSVLGF